MRKVVIAAIAVLGCGLAPLQAQVAKEVEVTKAYVPEVAKALKLSVTPDMTDTVRLRPEIDYSITPLALATNLSTEPFRPATVTYWEFNRPMPFYLKVGAGAPLNSVLDLYASTQNPGTGYVVGYLNHEGEWAKIRNEFGVKPEAWRMRNGLGVAAGKYLGRRKLEGALDVTDRVYNNYAFDGIETLNFRYDESGQASYYPFTKVSNDRIRYDEAQLKVRIGDDFTDLSRFNFDVHLQGGYFLNASRMQPTLGSLTMSGRDRYHEISGGGGVRLGKAFGRHALVLKADFDGAWRNFYNYGSTQLSAGLHYAYRSEKFRWSAGLDYVRDGLEYDELAGNSLTDPEKLFFTPKSESADRFLPAASVAYDPVEGRFMLYAELSGRVRRNDMRTLSRLNPYTYMASLLPNTEEHRVTAGIKGASRSGRFSYNLYVGYAHDKNALLWVARFSRDNWMQDKNADVGYIGYYSPYTTTMKDLSLNAEFTWRPSSRFTFDGEAHAHSYSGDHDVFYKNSQPYTLAYGRPQFTAALRGEYRARKVSLEVSARMQSVRHWTTYVSTYKEERADPESGSAAQVRPFLDLYDFKVPVTVDLSARFNWFVSRKAAIFIEGRNLCNARLYDWAYYRDYGVGFTAGVKLQF